MIGALKGKVSKIYADYLILNVGGVGYRVFCSAKVLNDSIIGKELEFIINTIVREDAILLFGFLNDDEKMLFDNLCKISGVGSKMALNIMSEMDLVDIIDAVEMGDVKRFRNISGIGSKIADRIIIELRDLKKKFGDVIISSRENMTSNKVKAGDTRLKDTISALENLGYQKNQVNNIVVQILKERDDIVLESLITETLKRVNGF